MSKAFLFVGGSNLKVGWLRHANSPGISCFSVDEESGAAELVSVTGGIDNPTFLSASPDGTLIAATSEVPEWEEGTITLYRNEGGALRLINTQSALGDNTAHNSFHPLLPLVAIANYSDRPAAQSIALYRIAEALSPPLVTTLHVGTGPHPRQERSHPHCVRWPADGRFLLVPDLGIDKVVIYRLDGEQLIRHGDVVLPPGSGPRHIALHPILPFAYVVSELASTVATLAWDAGAGTLRVVAVNSSLGDDASGTYYASGIIVAPDGGYLFAGNRGDKSSLARFTIDQATGVATLAGNVPLDGWPRDLTLSPSGRMVAVANQDRERIDLFRYLGGELTPLPPIPVGTPTGVCFVAQT